MILGEGIFNRGVGWPYSHGYSAPHGVHSDEIRECSRARGRMESNGGTLKQGKRKQILCKFYVQGHCRYGSNCRYLHDSAIETEIRLPVPAGISVHTNGHSWYPHHNASKNQMEPITPAVHTSAHVLSGYGMGNLKSDGIFRTDTSAHGLYLNSGQRSQNYGFSSEDFSSQPPLLLIPSRANQCGINTDEGQSSHILGVQNGMHAANLATGNSQMHQNNFLPHPKQIGDFFVPQAGVNVPALSLQGQSSSHDAYAISDVSSHNGHSLNINGQIQPNLEAVVHAVGSKETTGIPKHGQDSGTQSMQNTHNFQPVGVNEPTPCQTLQEVSVAPYSRSADRLAASIYHDAAASVEPHIMDPYPLLLDGKALFTAAPVGKQFSRRNRDPRLVTGSSAAPPSVPPIQNEATAIFVPTVAPPSVVPPIQQESINIATRDDSTHSVDLSHSDEVTGHVEAPKSFKFALANFVIKLLKKTWDNGDLTKELHKDIAQKVVEKVMCSADTSQTADRYLKRSREKIKKLIKDYLKRYGVEFLE
ncbi:unnamed protein product [Urochloa humidicola]